MNSDEELLLQRVRAQLDMDIRDLDATSASRLNQARQKALGGLGEKKRRHFVWYAVPACALMLALLMTWRAPQDNVVLPAVAVQQAADFDLLAGTEDLELIENLEFYAWLEQQSLDG